MKEIARGTWVEISNIILEAGKRAPQVPDDTQKVPLELRTKGVLTRAAVLGGQAEIETVAGRRLVGKLTAVNPAYTHGFGRPIAELTMIGGEVRTVLHKRGRYK